jgi:hypothetical protein
MARRFHLSRSSSNDDGVAEQMGRAVVLFLVENTLLFDRSSPLFCRGMEITARMGNGRQVGHTFPQPSSSVCSGMLASHENVMSGLLMKPRISRNAAPRYHVRYTWSGQGRCGQVHARCLDGRAHHPRDVSTPAAQSL